MKSFSTALLVAFLSSLQAQIIDYKWLTQVGSPLEDIAQGLHVGNDGSVIVTGHYMGIGDFDPGQGVDSRTSNGARDVFVQNLDSLGNVQWVYTFGGTLDDYATDVVRSTAGDVYVSGYFNGSVDFDPSSGVASKTSAGGTDAYLLKIDANGGFNWVVTFGDNSMDEGNSVAVDPLGNPILMGNFVGTVDFDPGSGTASKTSLGARDNYVVKFDAAGNLIWAESFGGISNEFNTHVRVDGQGGILAMGIFADQVDFEPGAGTTSITSNGSFDAYFLKLTGSGAFEWVRTFGGTGVDHAWDAAPDASGNWFVCGAFEETAQFGASNTFTSQGMADAYVAKLDASGNVVWANSFGATANGGSSNDEASCVVAHPDGGAVFSGFANGNWMLNNDPQQSPNFDVFGGVYNLKLSGTGAFEWAVPLDDVNDVNETGINSKGEFYMAGWFTSQVDFDFGPDSAFASPVGSSDMFLVKYKTQVPANTSLPEQISSIGVYPNPSAGIVYFEKELQNQYGSLRVYSANGQLMKNIDLKETEQILLPPNSGLYFLDFYNGAGDHQLCRVLRQ